MSRLFFALWPDEEVRGKLAMLNAQLLVAGGRQVAKEKLHITLAFLGNIDDSIIKDLRSRAATIRGHGFSLTLDRIGWFKRSRVTWLAPVNSPVNLMELVKQINSVVSHCHIKPEDRPYQPHLSLARKARKPVTKLDFEPIYWNINEFCLVESISVASGAEYKVLESWPLSSR